MRTCNICGEIYSFLENMQDKDKENEYHEKKLQQHMLWNHPEEQDVIDLYHEIDGKWIQIQRAYWQEDYIKASMLLSEVSTDALRFKKYIDMEL